jgi:hypothetical protein
LFLAVGFAPAFPESPLDDAALRPVRGALDTILGRHLPFPAMVVWRGTAHDYRRPGSRGASKLDS